MSKRLLASPLVQLTLLHLREFVREPEAVFWVLVFPIFLAGALGIAFRNAPQSPVSIAATTPQLAAALRREKLLDVRVLPDSAAGLALRNGAVALVAEAAADGTVTYRYDETNSDARTARFLADAAVQRAAGRADPVRSKDVGDAEPGSRYIDFLVPGLLGGSLLSSAVWGISFSVVDARRRKLMKRFIATPMPRASYLGALVTYRLLLMCVEAGAILAFGIFAFGVPVRGSPFDLLLLCVLSTMAPTALGLLLSARVRTIEGASGLANLIIMPMWIVSGVFFSAHRFPDALQPAINLLPLTAALEALRANMLQGTGLTELLPQLTILLVWTVVCFTVALRTFRWD